jgi:hypothetical protein
MYCDVSARDRINCQNPTFFSEKTFLDKKKIQHGASFVSFRGVLYGANTSNTFRMRNSTLVGQGVRSDIISLLNLGITKDPIPS